jgi:hypothetical protein
MDAMDDDDNDDEFEIEIKINHDNDAFILTNCICIPGKSVPTSHLLDTHPGGFGTNPEKNHHVP